MLDRSVRRVLRDKFALGLFETPYVSENPAEIRTVAREGVRATGGDIAMAGVDLGGTPPPEAKAAISAERGPVFTTDRRQYLKSNYSATSLAEAVRELLPKAEVTAVAGTGLIPKEPTDIPAAVAAARNADVVILAVGGRSAWSNERTEGEGSEERHGPGWSRPRRPQ